MRVVVLLLLAASGLGLLAGLVLVGGAGDEGDGVRHVELPEPVAPRSRVGLLVLAILGAAVLLAVEDHALRDTGSAVVGLLMQIGGASRASIAGYDGVTVPLLEAFLLAALVLFHLARPNHLRSLVTGFGVYLLTAASMLLLGATVADLAALTAMPPGAAVYLDDLTTLFVGLLGFLAAMLRTSALPRRYRHRSLVSGLAPALVVTGLALAVLLAGVVAFHLVTRLLAPHLPASPILVFLVVPVIFSFYELALFAFRGKPRPGSPASLDPPIDVIMPAWNEEAGIEMVLRSIERAGASYPGPVRVLVADDGSTDATVEVVERLAAEAVGVEIVVLRGAHGGKSRALNRALEAATAQIVVRIDADILVGDDVFSTLPAWFANPEIGCVGAFDLPNPDLPAWYTKGRLLECLYTFGFSRLAFERFDANNIPGTFMAFRRSEALALGGFVEGMNGEDSDLTFNLGRLGLVSVIDTSIVIYEDVPQTYGEFVKQRTRWSRASVHIAARHLPRAASEYTPRYAVQLRFLYNKVSALLRPVTYVAGVVLVLGADRGQSLAARGLLLLSIGFVPQFALLAILLLAYGYARQLPSLLLWLPFTVARKVGMISGLLSIPPSRRPAGAARADAETLRQPEAALGP